MTCKNCLLDVLEIIFLLSGTLSYIFWVGSTYLAKSYDDNCDQSYTLVHLMGLTTCI